MRPDVNDFDETRRLYREAKRGMLRDMGAKLSGSWRWAAPEFGGALERILTPGGLDGAECIWKTRHKEAWKCRVETPAGAKTVIYKCSYSSRPLFYAFHYSKNAREAANYRGLAAIGIPMANLLGCGDFRDGRILRRSFLVTEFAEGFRDGRAFLPGGCAAEETATRDAFLRGNLRYLAKMHEAHCTHRGFLPNNLLWRKREGEAAPELRWIDVTSAFFCPLPERLFAREIVRDLAMLSAAMRQEGELRAELLRFYLKVNRRTTLSFDELSRRVADAAERR